MPRPTPTATGVIIRDAHLQIDLRAQGYGRERLDLEPTPVNINYARRLRSEILGRIERGTFSLAEYFPNSPRIAHDAPSLTWKQLSIEWINVRKGDIQHSTLHHYKQTVSSYHFDGIRHKRLPELDFRTVKNLLSTLPEHPKTFNNVASVLKQIFEYGYRAQLLREPLHELIEMRRQQKSGPEPFSLAEIAVMLSHMPCETARNYYEFAFFSGLRPSEQIALSWSKVDMVSGTALIDAALTRWKEKGTKTSVARVVELTGRAISALQRQHKLSRLMQDHVFLAADGSPFNSTDGPLDAWWKPAMRASGLPKRDARQTRHTFATTCLMAGSTPGWIANQLGHAPEVFFRTYSRWIDRADQGAERRRLDAFLTAKTAEKTGT